MPMTFRLPVLSSPGAALLTLVLLAPPACSKTTSAPPPAPANPAVPTTPPPPPPVVTPVPPASVTPPVAPQPATPNPGPLAKTPDLAWTDLKALSYDARQELFAGLVRLNAQVDARLATFTTRRANLKASTDTAGWDFAMKAFVNARAYLQSTSAEMDRATPQTWDQYKDKLGRAWDRVREAAAEVEATVSP